MLSARTYSVLFAMVLTLGGSMADARDSNAEAECKKALEFFIAQWNTGEDAELRKAMNFPFVSFGGGNAVGISEKPEDFSQQFGHMRERDGWASSTFDFDSLKFFDSSPEKVHCAIDFDRFKADGSRYGGGRVMYIVTKQGDHWGVQVRTSAEPSEPLDETARAEIVAAARQAALDFMTAFNAADAEATTRHLNFPHLFMTSGSGMSVAPDAEHASVLPNFDRMREREGWHFSSLDSITPSIVTPNKVHLEVVFSRWHPDGTRYLTIPALWIATRAGDHWGIQLRSLMPARRD